MCRFKWRKHANNPSVHGFGVLNIYSSKLDACMYFHVFFICMTPYKISEVTLKWLRAINPLQNPCFVLYILKV